MKKIIKNFLISFFVIFISIRNSFASFVSICVASLVSSVTSSILSSYSNDQSIRSVQEHVDHNFGLNYSTITNRINDTTFSMEQFSFLYSCHGYRARRVVENRLYSNMYQSLAEAENSSTLNDKIRSTMNSPDVVNMLDQSFGYTGISFLPPSLSIGISRKNYDRIKYGGGAFVLGSVSSYIVFKNFFKK